MKNIKIIVTILAVSLIAVSCETYDDFDPIRPDYARFSFIVQPTPPVTPPLTTAMVVAAGQTSVERELEVFTSIVHEEERMFNISIESDIPFENFEFPSTVTVPANKARTTIIFRANDLSLPTQLTPVILTLSVHESNTSSEIIVPTFTFTVRTDN
jgi:hypothetical protein